MPLYEYKCASCGAEYEELVPITESKNPPCPACGSHDVDKKMSVCASTGSGGQSCGPSGFS